MRCDGWSVRRLKLDVAELTGAEPLDDDRMLRVAAATEAESAPLAAGGAKKRRSGAAARAGGKRQQLGNSELSRLWNLGARLARARLVHRRGQCEGGGGRCE